MKEGWIYKKLGELFPIIMGKTPPRGVAKYWDTKKETNNLWVSIADLSKREGKEIFETKEQISDEGAANIKLIPKGALLLSFKLSLGKMAFAGKNLYTNEAIISLFDNGDINLKFLYYYFSSLDWGELASGNEKVKGKTLNKTSLSEIPVALLPLAEQKRIVDRLDAAFAHIDALKANAEKQLSDAKALFQKALEEAMKPKEGWEEKTLGDVGTFIRGGNFSKKDFVEGGFPCIHYGQIHTKFGVATYKHLSCVPKSMVKPERCALKGDLVIAITSEDNEGSCKCTAWMAEYEAYVGGHTSIYKHSLNPIYISYYFRAPRFQKAKLDYTHGFKVVEINPKDIAKIPICVPPLSEQQAIVSRLDDLSEKMKKLQEIQEKTIKECDALKQAILREVFE